MLTHQFYILHCSKRQGPVNWCMSEKLEILSVFIGLGFLLVGVYCFLLLVGVDDFWVKSDIPLQMTPSLTGSPLDIQSEILGLESWAFSWVDENQHSQAMIAPRGVVVNQIAMLWDCCEDTNSPCNCRKLNCSFSYTVIIVCSSVVIDNFYIFSQCFLIRFVSNNTKASMKSVIWQCVNCPALPGFQYSADWRSC